MKKTLLLFGSLFLFFSTQTVEAQIWKKLKQKAEQKIEKKAEQKMDDVLNKKKGNTPKEEPESFPNAEEENKDKDATVKENKSPKTNKTPELWRNYKFIPGEKIIFLDDLKYEEVGEFPSRWDLREGGAEVASLNGEKVIIGTARYDNTIFPLFDKENYLTDEFTVEFDIYVDELSSKYNNSSVDYNIFFSKKRLESNSTSVADVEFRLRSNKVSGYVTKYDFQLEEVSINPLNAWHHISISFYKGKFKMYFDEKRIANIPRLTLSPDIFGIQFSTSKDSNFNREVNYAIKNIRIAHGGGQMYKRIIADGKYVTNGILFDSGKAILQPQSMGIINKVTLVMKENANWNFQIIGHTDSDGSTVSNLNLSKQRAEAVKQAIISLGINEKRLTISGKGESEPLNSNSSPEEKANNRRVEFIKK